jgi:hypothetical protein
MPSYWWKKKNLGARGFCTLNVDAYGIHAHYVGGSKDGASAAERIANTPRALGTH